MRSSCRGTSTAACINALVLCGAVPVYVNPEVDNRLGICLGMKREQVAKAIAEHPNAVAVLVNNPTYYGICSDLRAIVRMAHDARDALPGGRSPRHAFLFRRRSAGLGYGGGRGYGLRLHAQERRQPDPDLSLLLTGPNVHAGYVRQIINLTQTTSRQLSADVQPGHFPPQPGAAGPAGRSIRSADMAEYAREEINAVGGYYAFGRELVQRKLRF